MRITLLGLLVVMGATLLVLYAVKVHQAKNNQSNGTGDDKSRFPDDPGSPAAYS
jgi:hypothetical protein